MHRADWKGWDQLPASSGPDAIPQMMSSPFEFKSSLDRQPQPAQAETQTMNLSSESSNPLSLRPPLGLDSDGFTDTSPLRLSDEMDISVLLPMAVSEQMPMQHCESDYSPCHAPTHRQTSPHSTFHHTSHHKPSLYGHVHNHTPDRLLVHVSDGVSTRSGQLHSRPANQDDDLLKIIEHAQNSMAVAMQCVSAAAAAINTPVSDRCQQLRPHRNKTGILG